MQIAIISVSKQKIIAVLLLVANSKTSLSLKSSEEYWEKWTSRQNSLDSFRI